MDVIRIEIIMMEAVLTILVEEIEVVEEEEEVVVTGAVLTAAKKDISLGSVPTKTPDPVVVEEVETEIAVEIAVLEVKAAVDVIIVEKVDTFLEIVLNRETIDTKLQSVVKIW